jgi:hypothetical protein
MWKDVERGEGSPRSIPAPWCWGWACFSVSGSLTGLSSHLRGLPSPFTDHPRVEGKMCADRDVRTPLQQQDSSSISMNAPTLLLRVYSSSLPYLFTKLCSVASYSVSILQWLKLGTHTSMSQHSRESDGPPQVMSAHQSRDVPSHMLWWAALVL